MNEKQNLYQLQYKKRIIGYLKFQTCTHENGQLGQNM
jgi:hypothetical protein